MLLPDDEMRTNEKAAADVRLVRLQGKGERKCAGRQKPIATVNEAKRNNPTVEANKKERRGSPLAS